MRIYDLSVGISATLPVWPGNPGIEIARVQNMDKGDHANVSRLTLGVHTGTHVDAPVHFIRGASGVDMLPIDSLMGVARVIELPDTELVDAECLSSHEIRAGERILLRTGNSARCWNTDEFVPDYSHLSVDAAILLAERGIRLIGIDYLSIGRGESGIEVHRRLLSANVVILEGLNLSQVSAGRH